MGSAAPRNTSYWIASTEATAYPALAGDQATDVVVVGAGITGLTTAFLLARTGVRVIVVEAGSICAGATGFTTGKVTSQHGLVYAKLAGRYGDERAATYADAQESALAKVAEVVAEEAIECDLRRADAYVYTEDPDQDGAIEDEYTVAARIGLPAQLVDGDIGLPWTVRRAVRFTDQILFHPRRYCLGLAAAIERLGGVIVEHTRATDVTDDERVVVTTSGGTITADAVVLATQTPFLNRGAFFARTEPRRSYVIAAPFDAPPDGMYISAEQPSRSVRPQADADGTVLMVGGGGHGTGRKDDTETEYADLRRFAADRFGMQPEWQWSAQDFMPGDGVPYIGAITSGSPHTFVATGYAKWGMTNGTVAAMLVSDAILGHDNPWRTAFDSTRIDLVRSAGTVAAQGLSTAKAVIADRVALLTAGRVGHLAPGTGEVVREGGHAVAAFRDDDGEVHAVSATCTHLGCVVRFNTAERTWDCPCHGSRFGLDGQVLDGPATTDLAPVAVEEPGAGAPTD